MKLSKTLPLSLFLIPSLHAAEGWDPDVVYEALKPAEAIRTIEVPDGYELKCVASEPMVQDPTSFAFDGNGALYVCCWRTYMQDEHGTDQLAPDSQVVKLVDTDGDGVMDRKTVFIDNVVLPRAVLPLFDRVLVHFTQDSSIWSYFDDDKDGVADRRELSWRGEPTNENAEFQQNGLLWNLDNTICTNDRRFRWEDGKLVEMRHDVGRLGQFGLARDDDGRLVCSWGGGGNPAHSFQLPAGYPVLQVDEHAPGYERTWGICPVWDDSDGGFDMERRATLYRFTACCGQTVLRSPLMPEWYGNAVTCEPAGRLIRMSRFEWKDGVGVAHNAFPGREFIRSTDAFFRPVWTESGPDGALYISDMYRGVIQDKEWFPTEITQELRDRYVEDYRKNKLEEWVARYERVKKWGMLEVVRHGRIYRLLPKDAQPLAVPRMLEETPVQWVSHLASPNGWTRDMAQALLVSYGDPAAIPALRQLAENSESPRARIHALWCLRGLDALPPSLILKSLSHDDADLRRAAVQLAEPLLIEGDPAISSALSGMQDDPDARVATQVYLAYRAAGQLPVSFTSSTRPLPLVSKIIERDRQQALQKLSAEGKKGKLVYESLCTACHGPDGSGLRVAGKLMAPALTESTWFDGDGNVPVLARILLKGQAGPIDGVEFGEGLMMPLEHSHSDEQIAQVLSYIGEAWHDWSRPADASQITAVRSEVAERKDPWSHAELVAWEKHRLESFHPVPLGEAATADGSRGVYFSQETRGDRVGLKRYGLVQERGIPFQFQEPAAGGKNVIVLQGGMDANAFSCTMPREVEIPVNNAAGRLHVLGAVAGWGYPAFGEKVPLLNITVHYRGGGEQEIVLRNGIDIADHVAGVDVPGSARTSLTDHGQIRYLWRDLEKTDLVIEAITLNSPGTMAAPMIAAITLESAGEDGQLAPPPADGGPVPK
ncbi:DUF7133 domain-containing protein [Haloferula sargassicola]|uniref:Cytochrome c domain-containing protein n=1 Tax=Haloferula sargassicola TaxID=490096 RepID=A0ABP9UKJ3_9BACT